MSKSVCLFAYYFPKSGIPSHTRHLLAQISDSGFELHVAAAGLSEIDAQSFQKALAEGTPSVTASVYGRPNVGLDFGAWQFLLEHGCDTGSDEILFANDSVFGPLLPLRPIVERMRAEQLQVWGMVRSEAVVQHLQSWFVCMTRAALDHPAIQRVFHQPFKEMSKDEIVLHGELGLGLALQTAGLSYGAAWSSPRGLARLLALNPMHTDWRSVLRSRQAPFIKTELLRDNPSGIASVHLWRKELPDPVFFKPDWIDAYLAENPPRYRARTAGFRARMVQALASEDRVHAILALMAGR